MDIESRSLTMCEVAASGESISLGFVGADGLPVTFRLPLDQVGALAMTLPALIEKALRARFADNSLRYTYPLGSWVFERSSDPETSIVTLRTIDGFSVSFSIKQQQQNELSKALTAEAAPDAPCLAN
jgi:methylase of polypeptide subunit release factors